MSRPAVALRRFYDFHGFGIQIDAEDPTVVEAVDLRLRDFRCDEPVASPALRFEFIAGAPERPAGDGRPVYDMPGGALDYFPDADALYGDVDGVTLACRPTAGVAQIHCDLWSGRTLYLATHPLMTVSLMELLERRRLFSLHAGCLADADGDGVLLAGPSGAGKSTLALALARTGMAFLSDDVTFLDPGDDGSGIRAFGFADTIGVTNGTAERFPELAGWLADPPPDGFPKRLVRIEDLFGRPSLASCRPRALVFPEVARESPSAIVALEPGTALVALVPDVLVTDAASTQAHLESIAALLDQVQCYALRSGTDLARAAELVRDVL